MKKEDKIKLELEKQNLLYRYWNDAEKIELGKLSFLFGVIFIPTIINLKFNLTTNWKDNIPPLILTIVSDRNICYIKS